MRGTTAPRVVVVTRATAYEELIHRHATREQARFFLRTRGQNIDEVERQHEVQLSALREVEGAIPLEWRHSRVSRLDLPRFVFEPGDVIVAVGQDGLVANAAKYLTGQPVLGVNPDPKHYDGILVPLGPKVAAKILRPVVAKRVELEVRTMVEAHLDDGQRLLALNEVFVGHRTHQSARYRIERNGSAERQSSSGIIVTTGTGATGWARSVHRQRRTAVELPRPTESALAFFVREAFPSVYTGVDITDGRLEDHDELEIVSEMNEGGVLFGDGIEADRIDFAWGMRATVRVAQHRLHLVRTA